MATEGLGEGVQRHIEDCPVPAVDLQLRSFPNGSDSPDFRSMQVPLELISSI